MSEQKIFNPNNAVKMVQNRCKSAQTSTKYYSVATKLGPISWVVWATRGSVLPPQGLIMSVS